MRERLPGERQGKEMLRYVVKVEKKRPGAKGFYTTGKLHRAIVELKRKKLGRKKGVGNILIHRYKPEKLLMMVTFEPMGGEGWMVVGTLSLKSTAWQRLSGKA